MKLWSSAAPKLTTTSQSSQFDSLTRNVVGYFVTQYPICQRTLQRGAVKSWEINCNYTYMSVSHLLWNLRNHLSITALCQQTCLPSIISNIEDHKNEIWKTVRLTTFKRTNCHPFQFSSVCPSVPHFNKNLYLYPISLFALLLKPSFHVLSSIFLFHWDWWWFPML